MNTTRVARNLRGRIGRFSGDLSRGMCKAAQRFVSEMLYGIQASQSVMLTEIGRTLEEDISVRKTQWRLSRNLQRSELECMVGGNVLRMAASHIDRDTLIIIDPSDLSKKYARKMEFLARVRDGNTGELVDGYWTLHVIGAELDSTKMVPLYQRLWSAEAPGHLSENEEILRAIDAVMAHVGRRGLWIMDRGGDRINLFVPMLERRARFLFRLVGNRHLLYNDRLVLAEDLARSCRCRHTKHITRIIDGKETPCTLHFGFRRVRLPARTEPLCLLVIHGFGEQPLMLLTTEPLRSSFQCLWHLVRAYLKRWSIEQTIRFVKTCYDLENVRVRNYKGLQNLMPLVLAVMYFAACVLDHDARLRVMAGYVERAAKRVFGVPDFKYYALADGLRSIFTRHPGRPYMPRPSPPHHQLTLFTQLMTRTSTY
jgi:hypothetical protein